MRLYDMECCGLREYSGLNIRPEINLLNMCMEIYEEQQRFAIIIFTDTATSKSGMKLAAYIRRNKLGNLVQSKIVKNPNTKSEIKAWVFTFDNEVFKKWFNENKETTKGWHPDSYDPDDYCDCEDCDDY